MGSGRRALLTSQRDRSGDDAQPRTQTRPEPPHSHCGARQNELGAETLLQERGLVFLAIPAGLGRVSDLEDRINRVGRLPVGDADSATSDDRIRAGFAGSSTTVIRPNGTIRASDELDG